MTDNYLYKVYINKAYDRFCQQQPEVFRTEECLINIIKDFSISVGLPWHLVNEVYISINCSDEFHWVLAVVVLKQRRIRVYDSMSGRRHSAPSSEIQKLTQILPTYLDMSDFLDQKVCTDWSMIEAYRDKMGNPFDAEYVKRIAQQLIWYPTYIIIDCISVATETERQLHNATDDQPIATDDQPITTDNQSDITDILSIRTDRQSVAL
ncbi:hypothetical protein CQW23_03508 [Capsicum baccatum]|uniref:Ubiquitin-like protease family profile domain-containing protein n=1 Tax=Capsicum baccatum TaxID=33114 RepID=A0A2G2XBY7_CAPBA|nr:hypothetical protein CQW23_03508 [Capsicum baccatum]